MKILLINPPVFEEFGHVAATAPPLALLCLAGWLEKNGYRDIKVIDADLHEYSWDKLSEILITENPDIVGYSGVSMMVPILVRAGKITKKVLPNCKVLVGGFGPTKEPEKVLRQSEGTIDAAIMGEGELTLLELVNNFDNNNFDLFNIKGVSYLDENSIFHQNERREYVKDINILPWPAYHLLDVDYSKYGGMHGNFKAMKAPVIVMLASRGCPHRCTFCSLGSNMYRQRNPIDVVDEIEYYKHRFGAGSIQLYDDEFVGMSPKQNEWIEAVCDEIKKRGLHKDLAFLVQGRCSRFVTPEILKKMREANFRWIWWGVESGSQKILNDIKKDIKVADVYHTFSLTKKADIKSLMFIMIGFPNETPADIKMTSDLIRKVKPEQVRIHIVTPYPGSELRAYFEEHNFLETTDVLKFNTRTNVIHHTHEMSAAEIKKYYRMLIFRFENGYWYFIKFFVRSLLTVEGWKQVNRRLKMIANYIFDWIKIQEKTIK